MSYMYTKQCLALTFFYIYYTSITYVVSTNIMILIKIKTEHMESTINTRIERPITFVYLFSMRSHLLNKLFFDSCEMICCNDLLFLLIFKPTCVYIQSFIMVSPSNLRFAVAEAINRGHCIRKISAN